jgi:hypothetical protein
LSAPLRFRRAPGKSKHHGARAVRALDSNLFGRLRKLPVGQHLTHFASSLTLTADRVNLLRACDVDLLQMPARHWMQTLTSVVFVARRTAGLTTAGKRGTERQTCCTSGAQFLP